MTDLNEANDIAGQINRRGFIKAMYAEEMSDALVVADVNGIVHYFNPSAEKLFGYAASQIEGQNIKLLIPSRFHELHDEHMRLYWKNPVPKEMGFDRRIFIKPIDGEEIEATGSITPMRLPLPLGVDSRVAATAIRPLSKMKPTAEPEA